MFASSWLFLVTHKVLCFIIREVPSQW